MAAHVPIERGSVVLELGPGTGVVTRCLLERGVAESDLACLEYAPEFCALLRALHPRAHIVQGDAYRPDVALRRWIGDRPLAAVVSSLPLMARPELERACVIADYLDLLPPGAPFIQFTYSPSLPVKPERIGANAFATHWIKRNLPPARVLVYRRSDPGPNATSTCPISSI